jgi:hypothetical protein
MEMFKKRQTALKKTPCSEVHMSVRLQVLLVFYILTPLFANLKSLRSKSYIVYYSRHEVKQSRDTLGLLCFAATDVYVIPGFSSPDILAVL